MSIFFILLIIFFAWILLRPVLRLWWTVRQARKQADDFFRAASGGMHGSHKSDQDRRQGQRPYRRPRKRIDPTVGEYVEFEEVRVYDSSDTKTARDIKYDTEQQVEDADWEDIK